MTAANATPEPGSREDLAAQFSDRHPAIVHLIKLFAWAHLPLYLQRFSRPCAELAIEMVVSLGDGPELSAALRKLREAKDCFVTQALEDVNFVTASPE